MDLSSISQQEKKAFSYSDGARFGLCINLAHAESMQQRQVEGQPYSDQRFKERVKYYWKLVNELEKEIIGGI